MDKKLKSIGVIETPYKSLRACPCNISTNGPMCKIVVDKEYAPGLLGLTNDSKIMVLYWLGHEEEQKIKLQVHAHVDIIHLRGIFSLRTPKRPNPIGVAIVDVERVEGNTLFVKGLDCLNGTELIDLKPAIRQELKENK